MAAVIQTTLCKHAHFIYQEHCIYQEFIQSRSREASSEGEVTAEVSATLSPTTTSTTFSAATRNNESIANVPSRLTLKLNQLCTKIKHVQELTILQDAEKALSKIV